MKELVGLEFAHSKSAARNQVVVSSTVNPLRLCHRSVIQLPLYSQMWTSATREAMAVT